MCDQLRNIQFVKDKVVVNIINGNDENITIEGRVNSNSNNPTIVYWAANPSQYMTNYSGSGLPYYDSEQAYENTPNMGKIIANDKQFSFKIVKPSSYYAGLGTYYVQPHVNIKIIEEDEENGVIQKIELGNGIPFRSLSYPPINNTAPRKDPSFYSGGYELPVITQEQILRNSGYPNTYDMPKNFWGMKPPM